MRKAPDEFRPSERDAQVLATLSTCEQDVLQMLGAGHSLSTVARHLALSAATVNGHCRELQRKLKVPSLDQLRIRAAAFSYLWQRGARSIDVRKPQRLSHQSRWLPNVALSQSGPLSIAARRTLHCRSLRDVADFVRECPGEPGPIPDDPAAVLVHHSGTLGAKQALLAALAAEAGRPDVRLVVACHELDVASALTSGGGRATLPVAACYLRCSTRKVQIAEPGEGSIFSEDAVYSEQVEPFTLAKDRVRLYRRFARDWCAALDMTSEQFAQLRALQLHRETRRSIVEDLLGHVLPPTFVP